METKKLKNNSRFRNATANEIAKALIIDKLETIFYFTDNGDYERAYSPEFIDEIFRHLNRHRNSLTNKLNPKNDNIEIFY